MRKIGLLILSAVLLIQACKKDNGGEEGYDFTTVYKNTLNVQVEILNGGQYKTQAGKDTTVFSEHGIIVKAGETYESSYFVCTNCSTVYNTSVAELPLFTKMIIGDKVKIDTNCIYAERFTPMYVCGNDPVNFFVDSQWIITKNNDGNIIRREYVIDEADLAEAK